MMRTRRAPKGGRGGRKTRRSQPVVAAALLFPLMQIKAVRRRNDTVGHSENRKVLGQMESTPQDVLSEILETGLDVHRCAAARALGQIGADGTVEKLVKALLDDDPDVRTDVAEALGVLGDPSCAGSLMESLIGDPETDLKKAALAALIDFGHAPVVPLLRKLAVSRTDEIDWDEDEFYLEGWDSWVDMQLLAIRGLAKFGASEAVMDVLHAMSDEMGQDVSEVGVAALAKMGQDGAEALARLFEIRDPQLRRRIADAVVHSGNPHADPLIEAMLADEAPQVRKIAALGLASDDPRLIPLLEDPEASVKCCVVAHAGKDNPALVAALIADPDPAIRTEVFRVIAAHPDLFPGKDVATAVKKGIADDPKAARHAALALVALRGPDAIKGLTHAMTNRKLPLEFRIGAVEALQKAGPVSVPHLLMAAGDEDRQMRLTALTALVDFAANDPVWPNAAGEGLLAALNGELVLPPEEIEEDTPAEPDAVDKGATEEEREVDETTPLVPAFDAPAGSTLDAILSGGQRDRPAEIPDDPEPVELSEQDQRLRELSKQTRLSKRKMSLETEIAPHLDVRRFAASLLGGVPHPEVTENLINLLAGEDAELAEEALNSLVQHGEKTGDLPANVLPALLGLLGSGKSETRVLATRALAFIKDNALEQNLREQLTDVDPFIRVETVRALGNRGIADKQIEDCLSDSYLGVGIAAANSLARNRGEDAVDALVAFAFLNDGTYRRDIGKLLGTYARDAGIETLTKVLQDKSHRRDWLVAIDALAEIFAQDPQPKELKVA